MGLLDVGTEDPNARKWHPHDRSGNRPSAACTVVVHF